MTKNLPQLTYDEAIAAMENILEYFTTRPTERAAAAMAIDALNAAKAKWEQEHPIPLTFEQLMQVKSGTYIWTKVIHGCGIADGTVRHKLWIPEIRSKADFESYGKDWLAYLTEPPHGTEYLGTEFWEGENV